MKRLALLMLAACTAQHAPRAEVAMVPVSAAPASTPAPSQKVDSRKAGVLLEHIQRVLEQAGTLRGLPPKRPVTGAVLTRPELLAALKAHVQREVPHEAIVREGNALKLAGVLDKQLDYETIMFRLLEEQLAGFYSPNDETMSLAGDLDEDMADATLIHELIHALQDQYFDLKPGSKYRPGQSDRSFAHSALAEGDATSAMTDFMMGSGTQSVPSEKVEAAMTAAMLTSMPDFAPAVLQRSLVAPYVTGLRFVNAQRRKGGWDAVNAAWKAPPLTSEQILHTDKYEAHEPALEVPAPSATAFGPGYVREDDDSSGELGYQLVLESWLGHRRAAELARGWGGDRSAMLRESGSGAIAMIEHLRYDADMHPQALKLARAVGKAWGATQIEIPSAKGAFAAFCKERPDLGPAVILARTSPKSGDVVMSFGPTDPSSWTSKGTCTQAIAAAHSVLAPREAADGRLTR